MTNHGPNESLDNELLSLVYETTVPRELPITTPEQVRTALDTLGEASARATDPSDRASLRRAQAGARRLLDTYTNGRPLA